MSMAPSPPNGCRSIRKIMAAARKVWPSMVYPIASAVHNLVKTFWAVSGISNNVGYPFPLPGMLLLLLFFIMPLVRTERKFDPLVAERKTCR